MNSNCEIPSKPRSVKELLKSWAFWKPALGFLVGGLLGFLYYFFIGCSSGTCPITSSPLGSIVMGGVLGLFIMSSPCSSCRC